MKSRIFILAIWLATNAWAQNLPSKQPGKLSAAVKPSAAPSSAHAVPQNVKNPPANGQPRPAAKPVAAQTAGTSAQGARKSRKALSPSVEQSSLRRHGSGEQTAQRLSTKRKVGEKHESTPKGGRDPFVSPVVERKFTAANCTGTGRQCLVVGEITLNGVVRSSSGFIAVVVNGEHTYFLRENDPLADGAVEKISSDAITLRQRSSDAVGHPVVREVTKKLGVPAG